MGVARGYVGYLGTGRTVEARNGPVDVYARGRQHNDTILLRFDFLSPELRGTRGVQKELGRAVLTLHDNSLTPSVHGFSAEELAGSTGVPSEELAGRVKSMAAVLGPWAASAFFDAAYDDYQQRRGFQAFAPFERVNPPSMDEIQPLIDFVAHPDNHEAYSYVVESGLVVAHAQPLTDAGH